MKHDCERHVLPQNGIWPKVGNKFKKKRTEKKLYTQVKYGNQMDNWPKRKAENLQVNRMTIHT